MYSHIEETAALITIRNFLYGANEDLQIKLSREEQKALQTKIGEVNKAILQRVLAMDFNQAHRRTEIASTVDVAQLMETMRTVDTKSVEVSAEPKKAPKVRRAAPTPDENDM